MRAATKDSIAAREPFDWSRINRVLLIRLRSIGDTVLLTPSLAALKLFRPDIHISVLMEPVSAPLLGGHPCVDEIIVSHSSFASRTRLVPALRRAGFDVTFNMHGGTTGMILARLSGATRSVAYRGHRWSSLVTDRAPNPDVILGRARVHSVEQQLALLEWTGVPSPSQPRLLLRASETARSSINERLASAGLSEVRFGTPASTSAPSAYAVMSPAAALESKRWPAVRFAAVANYLYDKWGIATVVTAGPGQEGIAEEVVSAGEKAARLGVGLSLGELTALIESAALFVGNDSGPMHIAAAFDRPIVALFGSSDLSVWHPWTGAPYRLVSNDVEIGNTTLRPSRGSIAEIAAERVVEAVDDVLGEQARREKTRLEETPQSV